jgi:hypothetical protein
MVVLVATSMRALLPACDEFDGEVAFGAGEFGGEDGGGCVEVSSSMAVGEGLAEQFGQGRWWQQARRLASLRLIGVCGEPGGVRIACHRGGGRRG